MVAAKLALTRTLTGLDINYPALLLRSAAACIMMAPSCLNRNSLREEL